MRLPYKSKAQAAYMHINHPKIAKRWDMEYSNPEDETPKAKLKAAVARPSLVKPGRINPENNPTPKAQPTGIKRLAPERRPNTSPVRSIGTPPAKFNKPAFGTSDPENLKRKKAALRRLKANRGQATNSDS